MPTIMNHGYTYPSGYNYPVHNGYCQPVDTNQMGNTFSANQISINASIAQLLQEMQAMKSTINNLTLTNQNLLQGRNVQQGKGDATYVNSKAGLSWKQYCWSCGCCGHWS